MEQQTLLSIKCRIQIARPAHEVFTALISPEHLSNYFLESASAPLGAGQTVMWKWPEFAEQAPIRVHEVTPDERVSFSWDIGDRQTRVEFSLKPAPGGTVVTATESSMPQDEQGIAWLAGNSEGWANFLASLKAWLEHGVNLRKGAFDFL
jgi:uncharacterized protein YndB with AHSA1/START domain